jgi:putative ABC transport system substrate-binding protein
MRNMVAILSAAFAISAFTQPAHALEKKVPTIGFLSATSAAPFKARADAFRQGLRELGYVEGRNITIKWLYAEWKFDRLPALASELVGSKVDIIVSGGPAATRSLTRATRSIPIVMGFDNDPVGSKFVASLARPGGNVTGLSALAPGLSGKLLELLKTVVPSLSRLSVLKNSHEPGNVQAVREVEIAAKAIGIQLQYLDVVRLEDVDRAFQAVRKERADAVLVLPSAVAGGQRQPPVRARGGPHQLRPKFSGLVSACRDLRGPDPQGRKTNQLAGGATHEI